MEIRISGRDARRLMDELSERLGSTIEGLSHAEMMCRLRRVLELGVEALQASEDTETFSSVAWQSVEARSDRREATLRDLRHFVRRMLRVKGVAERPLRAMTVKECRELLQQAFGGSVHSYRKGRAILHSIFAYGLRREWCDSNPVDRIENPPVKEPVLEPLSPAEAQRLRAMTERPQHRDMRLSLYLMMYCGVRPSEVSRINPQRDILWQERLLIIRPSASKTGGGRTVPLRNVADLPRDAWVIPTNWAQRWRALRRAAGFDVWRPDTLRHTFATYHAQYFANLPQLQLEMGHRDLSLLRSRYVLGVSRRAAEMFWSNSKRPRREVVRRGRDKEFSRN